MSEAVLSWVRTTVRTVSPVWSLEALPADADWPARIAYGACLPFAMLRAIWRDERLKAVFLQTVGLQAAAVIVLAILYATVLHGVVEAAQELGATIKVDGEGVLGRALGTILAALILAEGTTLWIANDHRDVLNARVAVHLGLPPEDAPLHPTLRMNFRWLWGRVVRQLSGLLLMGTILPFLILPNLVPGIGHWAGKLCFTVWGVYWLVVFTAGKAQIAWATDPKEPWFIRSCTDLSDGVGGFPGRVIARYGRLWARLTRRVWAPATAFERAPFEYSGLGAARILTAVPVVSLLMRPAVALSATLVAAKK